MINDIVFLTGKQFLILKNADNSYPSKVAKKTDITYSHAVNILGLFEGKGLIIKSKQGRVINLVLTKKGFDLLDLYERASSLMGDS